MIITEAFVKKVLSIVDVGLVSGLGEQKPGKMCVEAAVAFAAGEPHNDNPACVHYDLAEIKISLNDMNGWPSNKARAEGLRRLAIAQLGSDKNFNDGKFWEIVREEVIQYFVKNDPEKIIRRIVVHGYDDQTYSTEAFVRAFAEVYGMKIKDALPIVCEIFVQALIKMKVPGTKYLHLTEGKRK